MRTNIVLDDELVREAFAITGLHSKKDLVHRALEHLVETEHELRRRARYDQQVSKLQQKTAGLVLRERPHEVIRADRDRR
jgi:Arc/MetJ family transcription regulator